MERTTSQRSKRKKILGVLGTVVAALFISPVAIIATTTGTNMPWNAPLQSLLDNLTGPTATIVALLALAVGAFVLMWGDGGRGAKRLLWALGGTIVLFGLPNLMSSLGLSTTLMM